MFTQVTPPHRWEDDSELYCLRLTLVGFELDHVLLSVDKYGHLVIRGDKQVGENAYITFEETFEVPKDSDLDEASGFFEDDRIFCITIPRKREGQGTSTHAIAMIPRQGVIRPVRENIPRPLDSKKTMSFHRYDSVNKPGLSSPSKDHLNEVTGGKAKKKKIVLLVLALLIALLIVVAVVVTVKLRRR